MKNTHNQKQLHILFLFKTIPRGSNYSRITFPWILMLSLVNKFVVVLFLSDCKFSTLALNRWSKRNLIITITTSKLKEKDEKRVNRLVLNLQIPHQVRFKPNISIIHFSFFMSVSMHYSLIWFDLFPIKLSSLNNTHWGNFLFITLSLL